MRSLLIAIQKSKKYAALPKQVVLTEIKNYFKKYPKQKKILEKPKAKQYKKLMQVIRGQLHKIHGSFQTTKKGKREELAKYFTPTTIKKLLTTNRSTKERLAIYPTLYKKLFAITKKPASILDLGCGLNPLAFPYMQLKKVTYFAYDIDKEDCSYSNQYFSKTKAITGKATVADIRKISTFPLTDVTLLFKILDPVDQGKGHKRSEHLIKKLRSPWIIASFSTTTVSGKAMRHPYRGWFERMLHRLQLPFKKVTTPNEVFYLINKHKN